MEKRSMNNRSLDELTASIKKLCSQMNDVRVQRAHELWIVYMHIEVLHRERPRYKKTKDWFEDNQLEFGIKWDTAREELRLAKLAAECAGEEADDIGRTDKDYIDNNIERYIKAVIDEDRADSTARTQKSRENSGDVTLPFDALIRKAAEAGAQMSNSELDEVLSRLLKRLNKDVDELTARKHDVEVPALVIAIQSIKKQRIKLAAD
jgi:hypothetical protein